MEPWEWPLIANLKRGDDMKYGHQGENVMFSPHRHASADGFFGIDGLRIILPAEAFDSLISLLAEALMGLRSINGDL